MIGDGFEGIAMEPSGVSLDEQTYFFPGPKAHLSTGSAWPPEHKGFLVSVPHQSLVVHSQTLISERMIHRSNRMQALMPLPHTSRAMFLVAQAVHRARYPR